jgi:hypothetical protein
MARIGRPPTCQCGECKKCKARERQREWYRRQSVEKRRAIIAARDPERVKASDSARYYRDPDKRKAAARVYHQANPERVQGHKRRWKEKNPEAYKAQYTARNALRDGKIEKGPCARLLEGTCHGRIEMHHADYSKPLEVTWLCSRHHGETRRLRHEVDREDDGADRDHDQADQAE